MFELFTERARRVVILGQEEARALRHGYIGPEHLLLGLLRVDDGLAARVLESLGITLERVRVAVVRVVGLGEDVASRQIPFTPQAKKVLEVAFDESLRFGHNYIGTEHLLLGIAREDAGSGAAALILLDFGADSKTLDDAVIRMLSESEEPIGDPSSPVGGIPAALPEDEPGQHGDIHLGWRGRPITLAALGAAVLARSAFTATRTGGLKPLQMQLLAHLILGPTDGSVVERGETVDSLSVALACDTEDLYGAIRSLERQRLISFSTNPDDERITITSEGATRVAEWLQRTAPLFARWPGDHPDSDDATG
jgi:DNA-binding MarR family transcriptional regulator